MATFSFQGTIVDASGEPQVGCVVTVLRKKTLRDYDTRQPIGTSDPFGGYSIGFTWGDVENGDFEVVVKSSVGVEIGRSVVLLGLGGGKHQVDVIAGGQPYRGRAEFRRIDVAVEPLAFNGAAPIAYKNLLLSDVDYLANKAKYPASVISTFIHAHRLAELTNDIPAEAFYGMLREGLSPELAELLAQGPEAQRAALDRAVARNLRDSGSGARDDKRRRGRSPSADDHPRRAAARLGREGPALPCNLR
ncbi:carboxypeptidase-like regulatory domain-containing protein [Nannocystaceae bacterium ST9]